jgi:hypothetical protein
MYGELDIKEYHENAGYQPALLGENYDQSQFLSRRLETLRLWRRCLKLKIVIAQPPFTRGPSEVFRIVDDDTDQTRNSATESIPASLRPLQATAGSNTEADDDCRPATFHRGAFGVKTPFSI